jgi:hypothetical protein
VAHVVFLFFFISPFSIHTNQTSDYAKSLEWRLRETRLISYDGFESKYYGFVGCNAMIFGIYIARFLRSLYTKLHGLVFQNSVRINLSYDQIGFVYVEFSKYSCISFLMYPCRVPQSI